MRKIPKQIVDMIEERNKLNKEIKEWCEENLDMDGMDSKYADITNHYKGNEQGTEDCKEWCDQRCIYEDWYSGHYYWETEYEGKYLHMDFEV